jgi:hypothetical protein
VDLDINEIAGAAAAAIATAMATDLWNTARTRVATMLGKGNEGQVTDALAELDDMQTAYTSAGRPGVENEVVAELRGQLRSRLRSDPSLAAELQVLTEEISRRLPASEPSPSVVQIADAKGHGSITQAGRDVVERRR